MTVFCVGFDKAPYELELCHIEFITSKIGLAEKEATKLKKLLKNLNMSIEEVFIITCPECSFCGYIGKFNEHLCPLCSFELTKSKIINQTEEIKNVKRKSN